MLYTDIIEQAAELGGIDCIGVASEAHRTAICFSGVKPIKKYMDGAKKISLIMQISGLDKSENQKELIDRLCDIGERLKGNACLIQGVEKPSITVPSLPVPTVQDGKHWIYSMIIELEFYTKGLI